MVKLNSVVIFFFLIALLVNSVSAAPSIDLAQNRQSTIENENELSPLRYELVHYLVMDTHVSWAPDLDWIRLREIYSTQNLQPIWMTEDGPNAKAFAFRNTINNSTQEALDPNEYHAAGINRLWTVRKPANLAKLEIMLTDAFIRYAAEVRSGYPSPRAVDYEWYIPASNADPVALLNEALAASSFEKFLDTLPPQHLGYQRLRTALKKYRQYYDRGEWPRVATNRPLRLGSRNKHVISLRERLTREGYDAAVTPGEIEDLFDDRLDRAVRLYQHNNGHTEDGVVGRVTRFSLNMTLNTRINQIAQNMERWRWLPRSLGRQYVMVNMAGYKLYYYDRDQVALDMRVIIGLPYRATPAFRDEIEYLEVNPIWSVPPRIATEDFLPRLRSDSNFLKTNRIKVFENWKDDAKEIDPQTIDWDGYEDRVLPFKFEQEPGSRNSLGRVKFMFPNKFQVYLHDTPSRSLFNESERTFSSGCIRVARPVSLATRVLGVNKGWNQRAIRKMIGTGSTARIQLDKPIPIYLLYWTVWVEDDGSAHFRRDIYQRNANIAGVVTGNANDT